MILSEDHLDYTTLGVVMATKIIKDVKINSFRVVFGKVNDKYLLAMPDVGISGYMDPFLPMFLQDNIIKLSNLFKTRGFRNITLSHLICHTVTELWKSEEEERNFTNEQ